MAVRRAACASSRRAPRCPTQPVSPRPAKRSTSPIPPAQLTRALADPANETPKAGDAVFAATSFALATRPAEVFRTVEDAAHAAGYECVLLGTAIEGEAREVAAAQARLARDLTAQGQRAVILSGGELTVTLRGKGRGGPNQEYALALAIALAGRDGAPAPSRRN